MNPEVRTRIRQILGTARLNPVNPWVERFERKLKSGDLVIVRKTVVRTGTTEQFSYRIEV